MASKPLVLYGHVGGPNPWKVAIVLEELGIPYETKLVDFAELKKEPFELKNPNGRVPVLEDPNSNITLFESGAIIEYLIDTYDKSNTLTYTSFPEKYLLKSWLHFQMSGQGPYWGQKAWFSRLHPEKNITSAIDRYANEIKRTVGVIDRHLKRQGTKYLVGDKCTYADLAFQPWQWNTDWLVPDWDYKSEYPEFAAWHQRVFERPAVKKLAEERQKKMGH